MKKCFLLVALFIAPWCVGQNMQVVFDFDALNRPIAKVMPFELATKGDTSVVLSAQYGLENNQERFRFIFTVSCDGQTFFKTSEHTFVKFIGDQGSASVQSLESMAYAPNSLDYHFVFTAGDLGYEDNDISLQRMGSITQLLIHELPEMDMLFDLPEVKHTFLKDLQSSLRIAYRRGDNAGASAVRGGFGNEKSSRTTKSR